MVMKNLENIGDFARVQFVSRSFYALVKDNCWTKVTRIKIEARQWNSPAGWVLVFLDTAIPSQRHRLYIADATELMEKLLQKATKTTAVHLCFYGHCISERRSITDVFLQRFLDALASISEIKIQEFAMEHLTTDLHSTDIHQALARFLNTKNQSLTSLKFYACLGRYHTDPIPDEIRQAFRDCRALEHLNTDLSQVLMESVFHEKTHLQTLSSDRIDARSVVALLESGARLRQFKWKSGIYMWDVFLLAYEEQVKQRNRTDDHPLRSLTKLEIDRWNPYAPFHWALFPCLEQLLIDGVYISIVGLVATVRSFLEQWASSDVEKALEWRMRDFSFFWEENSFQKRNVALAEVVTEVQAACGCHMTLTQGTDTHYTVVFNKGKATLKILIG